MNAVAEETIAHGRRARWQMAPRIPAEVLAALPGYSHMLCHLLFTRGSHSAGEIETFFAGAIVSHDPLLLPDMEAAVNRLGLAIANKERVAIYGDFDCDGITSAAMLTFTLRSYGLRPVVHIPARAEGHGLHPDALSLLADQGVTLIVSADCGVTALDEVDVARGMGMDVIVTDHHEARADGSLPDCITVCPTRQDSQYPCRFLCGAGVTFKLVQALARHFPNGTDPDDLLDLVALGTIADVVPLQDENRSFVLRGLERLRATRRPGLLALFQAAGIDPARIDPVATGYYLAPRINAANRVATPQLAYDLITAEDPIVAAGLAAQLSELNRLRQEMVATHLETVLSELGEPELLVSEVLDGRRAPVLIQTGDWTAGISGLLASKLVDTFGLPAFVGTPGEGDVMSFSARGIPGVHIDEILEACEASLPGGLFMGYGGHARAGGFRIQTGRLEEATRILETEARRQIPLAELGPMLEIDAQVPFHALNLRAAHLVQTLAPFGNGFAEPLFLVRNVTLTRITMRGEQKQHASVGLAQGNARLDGMLFSADPAFLSLRPGARLDIVCHFQINHWKGLIKPELLIRDWREAGQ
jgi:single-stranded-DNA-specific exonuclease